MIFKYFLLLIKIGLIALITYYFVMNPGIVSFDWLGWQIEIPLALMVLALLLTLWVVVKFNKIIWHVKTWPALLRQRSQTRREEKGIQALSHGLLAAAAGDAPTTLKQGNLARSLLGDRPIVELLNARGAQLSGDLEAAERFFEKLAKGDDTKLVGLIGLLRLEENNPHADQEKLQTLSNDIIKIDPKNEYGHRIKLSHALENKDWQTAESEMQRTKRQIKSKKDDRFMQAREKLADIYYEMALELRREKKSDEAIKSVKLAIKENPKHSAAICLLARLYDDQNSRKLAQKTLTNFWKDTQTHEVGELFKELKNKDETPLDKAQRIEQFASHAPDHWLSKLLMAEAYLEAELWGKTRHLLTILLDDDDAKNSAKLYELLATLEEDEYQDQEKANQWLKKLALIRSYQSAQDILNS